MKGFALGVALKQRRKATRKSPIDFINALLIKFQEFSRSELEKFFKVLFRALEIFFPLYKEFSRNSRISDRTL